MRQWLLARAGWVLVENLISKMIALFLLLLEFFVCYPSLPTPLFLSFFSSLFFSAFMHGLLHFLSQ